MFLSTGPGSGQSGRRRMASACGGDGIGSDGLDGDAVKNFKIYALALSTSGSGKGCARSAGGENKNTRVVRGRGDFDARDRYPVDGRAIYIALSAGEDGGHGKKKAVDAAETGPAPAAVVNEKLLGDGLSAVTVRQSATNLGSRVLTALKFSSALGTFLRTNRTQNDLFPENPSFFPHFRLGYYSGNPECYFDKNSGF